MKRRTLVVGVAIVFGLVLSGSRALAQSHQATEGPAVDVVGDLVQPIAERDRAELRRVQLLAALDPDLLRLVAGRQLDQAGGDGLLHLVLGEEQRLEDPLLRD